VSCGSFISSFAFSFFFFFFFFFFLFLFFVVLVGFSPCPNPAMSSSLTPQVAFATLQATALTARCHNGFFRKKQLKALHDALRENSSAIKDAIGQDTHVSDEEAATEVALALNIVKAHHGAIEVQKEIEREYLIANGKDAADKREPWGVVSIKPHQHHTPFFAVVAPLSAALAAGNCVALTVSDSTAI